MNVYEPLVTKYSKFGVIYFFLRPLKAGPPSYVDVRVCVPLVYQSTESPNPDFWRGSCQPNVAQNFINQHEILIS